MYAVVGIKFSLEELSAYLRTDSDRLDVFGKSPGIFSTTVNFLVKDPGLILIQFDQSRGSYNRVGVLF